MVAGPDEEIVLYQNPRSLSPRKALWNRKRAPSPPPDLAGHLNTGLHQVRVLCGLWIRSFYGFYGCFGTTALCTHDYAACVVAWVPCHCVGNEVVLFLVLSRDGRLAGVEGKDKGDEQEGGSVHFESAM